MAILSRLAGRLWNLTCTIVLALFCALPLALLAISTTLLAIFFTWLLAYRMLGAALTNRFDTWRSSEEETRLHQAQLHEFVQVATTGGPSLLRRPSASAGAGGRPRSSRTVSGASRMPGAANDQGSDLDYDYGYDIANDDNEDDDDDGSEALWLGGWRRRSDSRSSPNASTSATPATTSPYQHYRPRSNSNGGRGGIPNFSSSYAGMSAAAAEAAQFDYAGGTPNSAPDYYRSSVSSLPVASAPAAANVAARRSTTSVGSRRNSRVLLAESVRREMEMGEDA